MLSRKYSMIRLAFPSSSILMKTEMMPIIWRSLSNIGGVKSNNFKKLSFHRPQGVNNNSALPVTAKARCDIFWRLAKQGSMVLRTSVPACQIHSMRPLHLHESVEEKEEYQYNETKFERPILLRKHSSEIRDIRSKDFTIHFLNYDKPVNCVLRNTGKMMNMRMGFSSTAPAIVVQKEWMRNEYHLIGLDFHCRSKHVLEDIRYGMEIHMRHRNRMTDQTLMLVFPYKISAKYDNTTKEALVALSLLAEMLNEKGDSIYIKQFVPKDIIIPRYTKDYYSYMGSVSHPHKEDDVLWFVQSKALTAGRQQYETFFKDMHDERYSSIENLEALEPLTTPIIFFK